FEVACVGHGVRLRAYTGGDLRLSTAEGAYGGGMETLRARRESAVKSARVREGQDREARKGRRTGGGQRWFGYTRIYANPDEPNHKKRHILREDINPVEADAIRDAAVRILDRGESVASIARDWTARGIKPVAAKQWWPTSIVGTLISPRLAGLREWQGQKYPTTQWPDIRQRTEDAISAARREYDRLAGSATVMSDIPPSERVRDAWQSWSTDRKRAAIRAVLHRIIIKPLPPGANANVAGNSKNKA